jgi:hypothetical protein
MARLSQLKYTLNRATLCHKKAAEIASTPLRLAGNGHRQINSTQWQQVHERLTALDEQRLDELRPRARILRIRRSP